MKLNISFLTLVFFFFIGLTSAKIQENHSNSFSNLNPVIGILAQPSHFDGFPEKYYQYVLNANIEWIRMAGAEVVIIPFDETQSYYDQIFSSLNGILFTGGILDFSINSQIPYQPAGPNQFTTNAAYLVNKTIEANKQGNYFPIWGNCQGLQLLNYIVSGFNDTVLHYIANDDDVTRTVHFPKGKLVSQIEGLSNNLLEYAETVPSFLYLHELGVLPSDYLYNPSLHEFFKIGATSVNATDRFQKNATSYIAIVEARDYPIYANQFHPEYTIFEWGFDSNKSNESLEISTHFSKFFVDQARKNHQQFPSLDERDKALSYNFPSIHVKDSDITQITFIPRKIFE